ncbi:hypothetical protein PNIG_a1575 [Pseudoalteromonas nigrifaciens]|uniref:Orphan protein n=2 Tax=Pseudoalteromonas nigrifaciens TaxID=28109 RepID=A0AAC9UHM5_9GAMM|nr:hypothetical protein PNIG_a1575 [Pseudoalteromonas nigrifaciens]GEN40714.1 hypothetical protein PNI02_01800 [Pseudoalteromonas nigrifaciens]SUC52436.1 Uncharacterised protein [Pseudoalteromonas nigrifaciens]
MQNTVAYFCLTSGWLVLIVSLVFLILSTFKHTHFKQILLRYLNTALVWQLLVTLVFIMNNTTATLNNFIISCGVIITLQLLCNLACYLGLKRAKAKGRPSLDHFSMD